MKTKVVKHYVSIVCVSILMLIVGFLLSSCCSPSKRLINLNYENADESLGVESERLSREFNESTDIEITVPVGFEVGEISITLDNGKVLPYDVVLSDPTVDEGYEYTIERTIKFTLPSPIRNYTVTVDLGQVVKKRIDVSLSSRLYSAVHNPENGAAGDDIRMFFATINPNVIGNFMKFTPDDIIRVENFKLNDKLDGNVYSGYFEYNESVMLVYQKVYGAKEIPTIYSEVNHFTPYNKILNKNGIDYVKFDVAQRGNTYYTYSLNSDTRLFYLGNVQESFTLDSDIPNYSAGVDLGIEMEKNAFYLLSNLEQRNSDFMSIDMYASVNKAYDNGNNNMDKVADVVVEKIPEEAVVRNKYSAYFMYIGENLDGDPLISNDVKERLHTDIYVRVESIYDIGVFNFYLLGSEKPQNTGARQLLLGEGTVSTKGEYYFKIDKELIEDFILSMSTHLGDYVYPYESGSAIFYAQINSNNYFLDGAMRYMGNKNDNSSWNLVTSIRTEFNIQAGSPEEAALLSYYDYSFELYIDEDGTGANIDYGYIDYQRDNFSVGAMTYFDTTKLYEYDPDRATGSEVANPNNYNHYSYKKTLYLNIHAPEYTGPMYPVITSINFNKDYVLVNDLLQRIYPVDFEYAQTHAGVFSIPIELGNRYMGDEYLISINIQLATAKTSSKLIDFSTAELPEISGDGIYITNNFNFESYSDFTFISYANQGDLTRLALGFNNDLYYFAIPSVLNNFNIYLHPNDTDSKISVSKVLVDILGRPVRVYINGVAYDVMVMYQANRMFEEFDGNYFAY